MKCGRCRKMVAEIYGRAWKTDHFFASAMIKQQRCSKLWIKKVRKRFGRCCQTPMARYGSGHFAAGCCVSAMGNSRAMEKRKGCRTILSVKFWRMAEEISGSDRIRVFSTWRNPSWMFSRPAKPISSCLTFGRVRWAARAGMFRRISTGGVARKGWPAVVHHGQRRGFGGSGGNSMNLLPPPVLIIEEILVDGKNLDSKPDKEFAGDNIYPRKKIAGSRRRAGINSNFITPA